MKIGVTGCTGLIGRPLVQRLLENGHQVYGISNSKKCTIIHPRHKCQQLDLLDNKINSLPFPSEIECLVHTAWSVEPGNFWNSEKNFFWASKSFELISNTVQSNSTFVVSLGSCAEYEWPTDGLIRESTPLNPDTKYGKAKKALFEALVNSNLELLWPRIFFMYDGIDQEGKFLNYLHNSYINDLQPLIKNPEMKVDYVSIQDVAETLCTLISLRRLGVFNIGTGVGISNLELAQLMKVAIGANQSPIFNLGRKNQVSVVADTSKLNEFVRVGEFRLIQNELISFYKIG